MVEYTPAPDPRALLPPFLACLPAAFASTRPPPALLPLLSPILRQRVQILSSVSSSRSDSWLRLMCWDPIRAEEVETIVGEGTFEPHPVSGEIEIPGDIQITYKRLDLETLRSSLPLEEYNLTVIYVWCPTDQEGDGPGWKVAELLPFDSRRNEDGSWFGSVGEANERREEGLIKDALADAERTTADAQKEKHENDGGGGEEDDDDDYWARYDNTPGRTPGPKDSPAPRGGNHNARSGADDSYFGRYTEVQPDLDSDDPSMGRDEVGESSLNGDTVMRLLRGHAEQVGQQQRSAGPEATTDGATDLNGDSVVPLSHPRPSSASSSSDTVNRLEQTAETQSASEMGVKRHVSSSIKSLFRLARSSGISKTEFESMVSRELETLKMLEADDE